MRKKAIKRMLARALVAVMVWFLPVNLAPPVQAAKKNVQVPFASAARTASVDSDWFFIDDAETLVCFLKVTAHAGTSPTLDVKFQDSPDKSTDFDVAGASFTQVTASPSTQAATSTRKPARWVRCRVTIGGTSPSFTFAVWFMAIT